MMQRTRQLCRCCYFCLTGDQYLWCASPVSPTTNAELVMTWSVHGTIATYICPPGWYFADGGTRRTLICTDGSWPRYAPTCTGSVIVSF